MHWGIYTPFGIAEISILISLTLAPWLMTRCYRQQGESPRYFWRALTCILMGTAAWQVLILLEIEQHNVGAALGCAIGLAALWWVCWTQAHVSKLPPLSWLTLVVVLCNCLCLVAIDPNIGPGFSLPPQVYSSNNLNIIGSALNSYEQEHGQFPDDLRQLVEKENGIQKYLISPLSKDAKSRLDRVRQHPATLPYIGPCDYGYNRLPADARPGLVRVWEDPQHIDYKRPAILYSEGWHTRVSKEKLGQELARTQEWMKSHPYPTTATAPAAGAQNGSMPGRQ